MALENDTWANQLYGVHVGPPAQHSSTLVARGLDRCGLAAPQPAAPTTSTFTCGRLPCPPPHAATRDDDGRPRDPRARLAWCERRIVLTAEARGRDVV